MVLQEFPDGLPDDGKRHGATCFPLLWIYLLYYYHVYPDWMLEKMTEAERAEVVTKFNL